MDANIIQRRIGRRTFGSSLTESKQQISHRKLLRVIRDAVATLIGVFLLGCSSSESELSLEIPTEFGSEVAAATTDASAE